MRLRFEVRADRCLKEACGVLLLRGDIESLEKRLELMNQIDVLIVLIGLGYDKVNFFQDVQVGFYPRVLIFEDGAFLALLQDPAYEGHHVLHLFGSETFY